LQAEIQKLKGGLIDLSTAKQADAERINQLEKGLNEAQNFVVEQHKLGFSKALQQRKYQHE